MGLTRPNARPRTIRRTLDRMKIPVRAFSGAPFRFRRAATRADVDPPTRCRRAQCPLPPRPRVRFSMAKRAAPRRPAPFVHSATILRSGAAHRIPHRTARRSADKAAKPQRALASRANPGGGYGRSQTGGAWLARSPIDECRPPTSHLPASARRWAHRD